MMVYGRPQVFSLGSWKHITWARLFLMYIFIVCSMDYQGDTNSWHTWRLTAHAMFKIDLQPPWPIRRKLLHWCHLLSLFSACESYRGRCANVVATINNMTMVDALCRNYIPSNVIRPWAYEHTLKKAPLIHLWCSYRQRPLNPDLVCMCHPDIPSLHTLFIGKWMTSTLFRKRQPRPTSIVL